MAVDSLVDVTKQIEATIIYNDTNPKDSDANQDM